MSFKDGPQSGSSVFDGADIPGAGIMVRWTEWGNMWRWDVMSYAFPKGYQHVSVECGKLDVHYNCDE